MARPTMTQAEESAFADECNKAAAELDRLREVERLAREYREKVMAYRATKKRHEHGQSLGWFVADAKEAKRAAGEALFAALGNSPAQPFPCPIRDALASGAERIPENEIACPHLDCIYGDDVAGAGICTADGSDPRRADCPAIVRKCPTCGGCGHVEDE